MKLGCLSLSFKRAFEAGQLDLDGFLDRAHALGLDGVDLHGRHFDPTDRAALRDLKERCLRRGLAIACVAVPNNYARPAERLAAELEQTRRFIAAAQLLGAPIARVFAGWAPGAREDSAAWDRMLDCLRQAVAIGAEWGVRVALQNHNDQGLVRTAEEVLRALDAVPGLGYVLDTGQWHGAVYPHIAATADRAMHVRAKVYAIESGAERRLDYTRIFPLLRRVGYDGFVSIVYEGQEDELAAVTKAVRYFRGLLSAP